MQRSYRVDPARIYLMGHSMGAYGTWSTAMDHPEMFRGARADFGRRFDCGHGQDPAHSAVRGAGDDDRTVPVTQSRNMVEAGKKAGAEIVYVEVPGGSHVGVAAPAFAGDAGFLCEAEEGRGAVSLRGRWLNVT